MSSMTSGAVGTSSARARPRASSRPSATRSIASFFCAVLGTLLTSTAPALAEPPSNGTLFGAGAFGGETSGSADASTGTAVADHPIVVPPARGIPQPILGLSYAHTRTAVSEVGVGWSLGVPSVERRGLAGGPPMFDATDVYYFAGARLVRVGTVQADKKVNGVLMPHWTAGWTLFRPALDAANTRIFLNGAGTTFRVFRGSAEVLELGIPQLLAGAIPDPQSGIDKVSYSGKTFRWKLVRQFEAYASSDSPKNIILYGWERSTPDDVSRLADIYYTPSAAGANDLLDNYAHHIHLAYDGRAFLKERRHVRPLPWLLPSDQLVARIDVATRGTGSAREQVRRYHLGYEYPLGPERPFLSAVALEGRCDLPTYEAPQPDGRKVLGNFPCPRDEPTRYDYAQGAQWLGGLEGGWEGARAPVKIPLFSTVSSASNPLTILALDANRDGLVDIVALRSGEERIFVNGGFSSESGNVRTFGGHSLIYGPYMAPPFSPFPAAGLSAFGFLGDLWGPTWLHRNPGTATILDGAPNSALLMSPDASGNYVVQNANGLGPGPLIPARPAPHLLGDLDGDGTPDMLALDEADADKTKVWFSRRAIGGPSPRFGYVAPFASPMIDGMGGTSAVTNIRLRRFPDQPEFARLADIDGDGVVDYVTDRGNPYRQHLAYLPGRGNGNFGCEPAFGAPENSECVPSTGDPGWNWITPSASQREVFIAPPGVVQPNLGPRLFLHDVTGDGAAEMLELQEALPGDPTRVLVWFNIQGGFPRQAQEAHFPLADFDFSGPHGRTVLFGDVDGNGIDDLIVCGEKECGYLSFQDRKAGMLLQIRHSSGATTQFEYHGAHADMEAHQSEAGLNPWEGTGPWTSHAPVNSWPVKAITRSNHAPEPYAVVSREELEYRDPVFDRWRSTLRGYRRTKATTGSLSIDTEYLFGGCLLEDAAAQSTGCGGGSPTGPADPETPWQYEGLNGVPKVVQRFDATTAVPASTTYFEYSYSGSGIPGVGFVFASAEHTLVYDTDAFSAAPSTITVSTPLETTYTVAVKGPHDHLRRRQARNAAGKMTDSWDDGRVNGSGQPIDRPIRSIYDWQTTDAVFPAAKDALGSDYLLRSIETKYDPGGAGSLLTASDGLDGPSRKNTFGYDGLGRLTLTTSVAAGGLTLNRSNPGGGTAPLPAGTTNGSTVTRVALAYDLYGNVTTRSTTAGCETMTYDPQFFDYPRTSRVWLDGCNASVSLDTSVQLDRGLALPIKRTEVNGIESGTTLDNFGRPKTTWLKPSQGTPTNVMQFEYVAPGSTIKWVHATRLASDPAKVSHTWVFGDTWGSALATLTQADASALDYGDFVVHAAPARNPQTGVPVTWFKPWFHQGAAETFAVGTIGTAVRSVAYDFLLRPKNVIRISDGHEVARTEHHGLATTSWDAESLNGDVNHIYKTVTSFVDGHGRPIKTQKIVDGGVIATVTDYVATGELAALERRSRAGQTLYRRWMRYDAFGRLVENAEPNSSVNFGNTPGTATTMKAWRYAYDMAGRLVGTSDARGCGKNLYYDNASRLIAEDWSPCLPTQPPYSPYSATTGDGSEVFNKYDTPESGEPASDYGNVFFLRGALVSTRDRGAHTRLKYDGRGRVVGVAKRIAKPGDAATALSSRYTNRWFRTATIFDEVDRVDSVTTGADVPELLTGHPGEAALGSSFLHYNYSARGTVSSIDGSYGTLHSLYRYAADGAVEQVQLGDAASSLVFSDRNIDGRLMALTAVQQTGGWQAFPRTHLSQGFAHDENGNIKEITDYRIPWEWPSGAQPVSRTMTYDEMYRIQSVAFAHGADPQTSPFEAEENASNGAPLPRVIASQRVTAQSWSYDDLGNVKRADDDTYSAFDRGFGLGTMGSISASPEWQRKPNQLLGALPDAVGAQGALEAHYDAAGNLVDLAIERDGVCSAPTGKCAQRFLYEWDEVGQLTRALRHDYPSTVTPEWPTVPPPASASIQLKFQYSQGQRVIKTSVDPVASANNRHAVEIFGSLRLNNARYLTTSGQNDFERNASTETVYLGGVGRVVYQPGLPNAGSDLHVFLQVGDHLGSATAVLDKDTGEVVEYATYLPYGATESDYRPTAWQSFREDYRFTGKEEDVEVGLTYFGARYYSPYLARFVSPDPLTVHAAGADLNPYAYVAGSVFNATDPTGLCAGSIGAEMCPPPGWELGGASIQIGFGGSSGGGAPPAGNRSMHPGTRGGRGGSASGSPSAPQAQPPRPPPPSSGTSFGGVGGNPAAAYVAAFNSWMGNGTSLLGGARNALIDMGVGVIGQTLGTPLYGSLVSAGLSRLVDPLRSHERRTVLGTVGYAGTVAGVAVLGGSAAEALGVVAEDVLADGLASGARGGPLAGRGVTVIPGGTGRAIAGHGYLEPGAGTTTVPQGTSASFWTMDGTALPDAVGTMVEQGNYAAIAADPALAAQVEGAFSALPGATVPNYTVGPPVGLTIMGNSRVVGQPTPLQRLLGPNMGHLDCAFCLE